MIFACHISYMYVIFLCSQYNNGSSSDGRLWLVSHLNDLQGLICPKMEEAGNLASI